MTRDEAKAIYTKYSPNGTPDATIDFLEEVGLLKLDKPQTPDEKAMELLNDYFDSDYRNITGLDILLCLKEHGLQIVEMK